MSVSSSVDKVDIPSESEELLEQMSVSSSVSMAWVGLELILKSGRLEQLLHLQKSGVHVSPARLHLQWLSMHLVFKQPQTVMG